MLWVLIKRKINKCFFKKEQNQVVVLCTETYQTLELKGFQLPAPPSSSGRRGTKAYRTGRLWPWERSGVIEVTAREGARLLRGVRKAESAGGMSGWDLGVGV